MQNRRFLVGIFAGLLFAMAIVLSGIYVPGASTPLANSSPYTTGAAHSTTVVVRTLTSTEILTQPAPPSVTNGSISGLTNSITSATTTDTASSPTSAPEGSTTTTAATATGSSSGTYAASSTTEEVTSKVVTTVVSSTETLSPDVQGDTSSPSGGSQQPATNGLAASPSSVSRIVGAPVQSAVFLLPVLIAVLLGLVLYKASVVRE